jgi:hypothetical protein
VEETVKPKDMAEKMPEPFSLCVAFDPEFLKFDALLGVSNVGFAAAG